LSPQVVVDLLVTGSLYTLLAVGLSLVFSVMRIVNFAHAQMYMVGAYSTYLLYGVEHWPFLAALVTGALATGLLGLLCELTVIRPIRDQPQLAMISTLGLLLLLGGLSLILFGANGQFVSEPVKGTLILAGARINPFQVTGAASAIVIVVMLSVLLAFTRIGRALRAVAQNEMAARLQGIRVGKVRSFGFVIGTALAAIAGGLILPLDGATPDMGNNVLLDMFIVVVLGGLGSVPGAVVGAFLLALFQTVGVSYFGQYSVFGVYVLVMLMLLIRPQGILGEHVS
jgi:branched-chain amino acid transport system permease protein